MEQDLVDESFLTELQQLESQALDHKRRKISTLRSSEGDYIAALKGSKSESWQSYSSQKYVTSNRSSVVVVSDNNGSNGGNCYKCGKLGHWARDCTEGGNGGDGDVEEKMCKCGLGSCLVLTANTEKNRGRKFYRCPAREENGGCGFFEWCDNTSTTPAAKAQYSVSNTAQSPTPSSTFPDVPCPCGAGICLILTAKTEKNMGQQFYRCPASQESKCNFFKWCIERNSTIGQQSSTNLKTFSNTSSSFNKSSTYGEANRVNSCYKCGQDGHWAKDCKEPSSGSPGFDVSGNKSGVSGTCYKCGVPGHWAKDCVMKASYAGGASAGVGGKSESSCYKCFKPGHWARDCPVQDRKVGQWK
ncbi:hypothetical protein ACHQM5_004449 [Ranunculus cassubicifolius]